MRVSSFLLFAFLPFAFGDVKFSSPKAGDKIKGGSTFTVTWTEGGNAPSLSDASSYVLVLYSGSNANPFPITTLVASGVPSSKSQTVTVAIGLGGDTTNAYFLGMTTIATAGGQSINYSGRFTLTGMTGTFPADVVTDLKTVTGTAGPADVPMVGAAPAAGGAEGAADVPFDQQSGPTRYAPMQSVPPTSITATNTAPLNPTSSVVIATTFLPIPTIQTTITAVQTFSVASSANTAAPQPQPSDDMAKFLNRWKD